MKIIFAEKMKGTTYCTHGVRHTEHDGSSTTHDAGMSLKSAIAIELYHCVRPGEQYMIEKSGEMTGPFTKPGPVEPEGQAGEYDQGPFVDPEPPAEEAEPAPEHGCKYEVCKAGQMVRCGETADATGLCAEHWLFVKDSTEGPFTRSKKPHPAGFNWVAKARQAYGVKGMTLASMGRPSDAGKQNPTGPHTGPSGVHYGDIDAWAARAPWYDNATGAAVVLAPIAPVVQAEPEPVAEPVPVLIGAQLSREIVRAAVRRLHEHKDQYVGKHIHPILWGAGFRVLYRGGEVSEAQYQAIVKIAAKQPEKYGPIFQAA